MENDDRLLRELAINGEAVENEAENGPESLPKSAEDLNSVKHNDEPTRGPAVEEIMENEDQPLRELAENGESVENEAESDPENPPKSAKDPNSIEHQMTHKPKLKDCPTCQWALTKRTPRRRTHISSMGQREIFW